mgnify:CR=1 FL=1
MSRVVVTGRVPDAAIEKLRAAHEVEMWPDPEPIGREDLEFDWGPWHLVQDQTWFAVRVDDAPMPVWSDDLLVPAGEVGPDGDTAQLATRTLRPVRAAS